MASTVQHLALLKEAGLPERESPATSIAMLSISFVNVHEVNMHQWTAAPDCRDAHSYYLAQRCLAMGMPLSFIAYLSGVRMEIK